MATVSADEAKDLVQKWALFWRFKWQKMLDTAKQKTVSLPTIQKQVGGTGVSLSERGLEFTWGNGYIQLEKLIMEPTFKLKDLSDIRTFVEEIVENAHRDIESAVVEREQAFQEVFEPFRSAAAMWSLEENKRNQKKF